MLFFAYKNLCDDHMINLMGKTTVIRFIPDDKAFAKAYAEFIKRKKERGEECS